MDTTQTDQPSPLAPDESRPYLVAKPAPGGKGPSRRGWTEPDCTDRHETPPETVPDGRKVWRVIGRAWAVLDADTAGTRQILAAVAPLRSRMPRAAPRR